MSEVTGTNWTCYDAATMTAREIYGRVLAEMSRDNEKIIGITGDLAKSTAIAFFEKECPERFVNVGIAEQNLMGMAAGLAKSGLIPFATTFATFASMRAAEQVRTDICYQELPVKIIATHAGVSFGAAGTTHHCTEDLAIMRSFANMTVIAPADGIETANAVRASVGGAWAGLRLRRCWDLGTFGQRQGDPQDQLANVLDPGQVQRVELVGCAVVVRVNPGEEEQHRDPLAKPVCVVASAGDRIGVLDLQGRWR